MATENERQYYHLPADEVLDRFEVDGDSGLAEEEVAKRRRQYGSNRLKKEERRGRLVILAEQFKSIVIIILLVAGVFAFFTGRYPEAVALLAVTVVNTAIGFFTELKAVRSMEALRRLGAQRTRVRRGGEVVEVGAAELVPGDIVELGEGELVPADLRLLAADGLRLNEAALTGESAAVSKSSEPVASGSGLHERTSMLYKGTSVVEGSGRGVVTATAMATELGRIARLAAGAKGSVAPLQKRLDGLGRRLAYITLGVAVLVGAAGLAVGREAVVMIETAIALGVAAVPEGLPIVATIALARGMWLMARRNALVNRLTAVETLGATTVIFTDKTGTLTENSMRLARALTAEGCHSFSEAEAKAAGEEAPELSESLRRLLRIGALCTNARADEEEEGEYLGDPTEAALLAAAEKRGLRRRDLLEAMPELREVSFDSATMKMATVHAGEGEGQASYVAVKGAVGEVLADCSHIWEDGAAKEMDERKRRQWQEKADEMAAGGLRLLALADREMAGEEDDVYHDLRFAGLVGLEDPPRGDVAEAVRQCREAGIQVLMVTGDRPDTGVSIGEQVGLGEDLAAMHGDELAEPGQMDERLRRRVLETTIFARVTPEQKLRLVELYQDEGEIVAMTGDGVNDTPALKQADIGVAMGRRGTDAAKQVADMVLRDDRFATIVAAVREGRVIFANIRKSVIFMLCTNIAEVLAVTLASLLQIPLPLRPLQILYLNVLTDVFPALALGVGSGGDDVMQRRPRAPDEAILTRHHWRRIALWSVVVCLDVLAALAVSLYGFGFDKQRAVTVSFLTLAFAKLWFVLNLRDRNTPAWRNDVLANRWIWAAWGGCLVLLLTAVYWPPLATVMQTTAPQLTGWLLIVGLSLVPAVIGIFTPGIRFYAARQKEE